MPRLLALALIVGLAGASCRSLGDAPALVQPGAPGQPTRSVSAAEAAAGAPRTSEADVQFMQGMIAHHAQAVEMTALVGARSRRDDMRLLADRITASQEDEMAFMKAWLEARGQAAPEGHAHHQHGAKLMPGMLAADDMARLTASTGAEFDRLFLEGMIKHHAGALTMVADLFATRDAGQETEIFSFASDVDADQRIEIARMEEMWLDVIKSPSPAH
jgi:uncharacterized protein (DUF305 family)